MTIFAMAILLVVLFFFRPRTYLWETSKSEEDFFSDLEAITKEYYPKIVFLYADTENFFLKKKNNNGFMLYRHHTKNHRCSIWLLHAKIESIPTGCRITAHFRPHISMVIIVGWLLGALKTESFTIFPLLEKAFPSAVVLFFLFCARGDPQKNLAVVSQAAGVDFTEHFLGIL